MHPTVVFIVPYRNRVQHKTFFINYMTSFILHNELNYEIYFAHQVDGTKPFNRGAMKNIGFLAIKNKYPMYYKDITFVFNDVDTVPYAPLFNYATTQGTVKHFYGYTHALGGIVSITGADFERVGGFPNFWGWGMEDTVLQQRCDAHGLVVDRSQFYPIGDANILQFFDGLTRNVTIHKPMEDGLVDVRNVHYTIECEHTIFYIQITSFQVGVEPNTQIYTNYDIREPVRKVIHPLRTMLTKR